MVLFGAALRVWFVCVARICSPPHPSAADFSESHIREFDKDVRSRLMELEDPNIALAMSKSLKDEGNRFF